MTTTTTVSRGELAWQAVFLALSPLALVGIPAGIISIAGATMPAVVIAMVAMVGALVLIVQATPNVRRMIGARLYSIHAGMKPAGAGVGIFHALKAREVIFWRWMGLPTTIAAFFLPFLLFGTGWMWGFLNWEPSGDLAFLFGIGGQFLMGITLMWLTTLAVEWRAKFLTKRDFDDQVEAANRAVLPGGVEDLRVLDHNIRALDLEGMDLAILPINRTAVTSTEKYARNVRDMIQKVEDMISRGAIDPTKNLGAIVNLQQLGKISEQLHRRLFWWFRGTALILRVVMFFAGAPLAWMLLSRIAG